MTIFDVLEQDVDSFIMVANYLIGMGNKTENTDKKIKKPEEKRIRVNDKTATGGWF